MANLLLIPGASCSESKPLPIDVPRLLIRSGATHVTCACRVYARVRGVVRRPNRPLSAHRSTTLAV